MGHRGVMSGRDGAARLTPGALSLSSRRQNVFFRPTADFFFRLSNRLFFSRSEATTGFGFEPKASFANRAKRDLLVTARSQNP